jgi:hypothetical protein
VPSSMRRAKGVLKDKRSSKEEDMQWLWLA